MRAIVVLAVLVFVVQSTAASPANMDITVLVRDIGSNNAKETVVLRADVRKACASLSVVRSSKTILSLEPLVPDASFQVREACAETPGLELVVLQPMDRGKAPTRYLVSVFGETSGHLELLWSSWERGAKTSRGYEPITPDLAIRYSCEQAKGEREFRDDLGREKRFVQAERLASKFLAYLGAGSWKKAEGLCDMGQNGMGTVPAPKSYGNDKLKALPEIGRWHVRPSDHDPSSYVFTYVGWKVGDVWEIVISSDGDKSQIIKFYHGVGD